MLQRASAANMETVTLSIKRSVIPHLEKVYGRHKAAKLLDPLVEIFQKWQRDNPQTQGKKQRWDASSVLLITYADTFQSQHSIPPLECLHKFLENTYDAIPIVHLLPCFPYSSDGGFAVKDYEKINPECGDWSHIELLSERYTLMFDLVINHCSASHPWFLQYQKGELPGKEYFVEIQPQDDLTTVVRPRSTPLRRSVNTPEGEKDVWSTFSTDQIDLDFSNPDVFLETVKIVCRYLAHGATFLRLDAVGFVWKIPGTESIHLPETHSLVKALRNLCALFKHNATIVTETNVPLDENLSYFGEGDEAHVIYNFTLPPLLLHTFLKGDSEHITSWAETDPVPPPECAFLNISSTHDGIGLRGAEGILSTAEIDALIEGMKDSGGLVSMRSNREGHETPYEINIAFFDAMKKTFEGEDNFQVERFLASQYLVTLLRGIPSFYIHCLLGTPNDHEARARTNHNRDINRSVLDIDVTLDALSSQGSRQQRVLRSICSMLRKRAQYAAFHPEAEQEVLRLGTAFFGVVRGSKENALCAVINVTRDEQSIPEETITERFKLFDVLHQEEVTGSEIAFNPYQMRWFLK